MADLRTLRTHRRSAERDVDLGSREHARDAIEAIQDDVDVLAEEVRVNRAMIGVLRARITRLEGELGDERHKRRVEYLERRRRSLWRR